MTALIQTSKTSPKNCLIASSVCGLVGLFGILVPLPLELEAREPIPEALVEGVEVYGVKGGKENGVVAALGAVLGGCGR